MYWGDVFIQKRTVKKTNTAVSALGFGAMRLPTKNGMIDKKEATQLINHAIDKDVTDETYTITLLDDKKHIIALFDSSYKPKVQKKDVMKY